MAKKIPCLGMCLYPTLLGARYVLQAAECGCKLCRAFCQLPDTEIISAVRGDRGHNNDVLRCYGVTGERAGQAPLAGLLTPVCGLHSLVRFCLREP